MRLVTAAAAALALSALHVIRLGGCDSRASSLLAPRRRPGKGLRPATRLVLEIPVMEGCRNVPENAVVFKNMSVGMVGKSDFVLNGGFEITREAKDIGEVQIEFTKCREQQSANTCEHFQTWRFNKGVCSLLFKPNTMWSRFHDYVAPRPTCPVKVGQYTIRNATLDMKTLQSLPLPLEGNVWFVKFSQIEPSGKVHTCTDTELRFHRAKD
ncbi:putative oxidoreductase YeiQ [Frankliniella fusca]|uniref:Oxidoreductase YeiQ n=1 Tax=Frankliniella fusca TaxID=407009 RepID=A0AAE1HJR1_9NEOP|nr:putative oxidoreductase YeiQ [Frankliniella fusca]